MSEHPYEYDLAVIGGGSGGLATARRAAMHGAKVVLIEGRDLGGTCVNVGCVPKKVMWNAAQIVEQCAASHSYGFEFGGKLGADFWPVLKKNRDRYIARLHEIYQSNLDKSGVELVHGFAAFRDAHTLVVSDRTIAAKYIVIAVGGEPFVPSHIPGASLGITSNGFFELEQLPKKVLICGAGYIGVEIAGVLNALGSEVVLVMRGSEILRGFDQELAKSLSEQMIHHGIRIIANATIEGVESTAGGLLSVRTSGEVVSSCEQLIWATGRTPLTRGLGLERAGIETSSKGHIVVDDEERTSVEHIFAIGDVIGKADLTPVAIAAGRRLAERLFAGKQTKMDYSNIASVVFSHPPLGTIGLTEEEANSLSLHPERNHDHDHDRAEGAPKIKVYRSQFTNMFYALESSRDRPRTLMKMIVDARTDRILGLHVLGMGADEMLQGFAVAIKMGATKADFDRTVAIHPVAAEEFVTMT